MRGARGLNAGVETAWRNSFAAALDAWSAHTLLREPLFLRDDATIARERMTGQIAAIRLRDAVILVNVHEVTTRGLASLGLPILAHEVGHHVYVPGNLRDHAVLFAALSRALTGLRASDVHLASNLYADLLINDRLQRRVEIDVAEVYRTLVRGVRTGESSRTWTVISRACEHMWRLEPGELVRGSLSEEMDADALLVARIVRHFGGEWLRGARQFGHVLYPYLAEDAQADRVATFVSLGLADTDRAAAGAGGDAGVIPDGLVALDAAEWEDEELNPGAGTTGPARPSTAQARGTGHPGAQLREPFEYGELLKSMGLELSQHEITTRYYRELALPHLIPFPAQRVPVAYEPLREGAERWELGDPLESVDWLASVLHSPLVIPGVTTLQPVFGLTPGPEPAPVPVDLDIYVDCSGSMPDPSHSVSYLALAATILSLSALRAGARVQATLWSSAGVFETTNGFLRDEKRILGTVTGYVSGGTAFPIHLLRDTYASRKPTDPPVHIVVISDDGADTMLATDEKGNDGRVVCAEAIRGARGGGTLVLNLWSPQTWPAREPLEAMGFRIHAVRAWPDLLAFARAFVKQCYAERHDKRVGRWT